MSFAHYLHRFTLLLQNKPGLADASFQRALETSPHDACRLIILSVKALATILDSEKELAINLSREAQLDAHATFVCDIREIVGLVQFGRLRKAQNAARRSVEKTSGSCIARFNNDFAFMGPEAQHIFVDGLTVADIE